MPRILPAPVADGAALAVSAGGAGKSAAGSAQCGSVWWAAQAAFFPLKVLPKQAPKPDDYRVNVAFKSLLLVWKERARLQHHRQELFPVQRADPAVAEASTGPLTPAMCSYPSDGVLEQSQRRMASLDHLYPSSHFPNPKAPQRVPFPSCPTPFSHFFPQRWS